jgi:3-deoxy-manno-octulosonate cytidylyltransferase (CMP-KDO synthetase)
MIEQQSLGIIPARYQSSRFPGKPLVDIMGKTMIRRVYEQAAKSKCLSRVIVATDDSRIADEVMSFGGEVCMTSSNHQTGTDRCAEVVNLLGNDLRKDAVVINIQGDEPFIDPSQINDLCSCFLNRNVELATLTSKFGSIEEVMNHNTIKVVKDLNGFALYFSRQAIPFFRDNIENIEENLSNYNRHIGIYGYRVATLQKISKLSESFLEKSEKLEQLRWLENGFRIMTAQNNHLSISVDTPEDLKNILSRFS